MSQHRTAPPLTICVLAYGDHFDLAQRCIESIRARTPRALYRLVVGANAVGERTETYLQRLRRSGHIDRFHGSHVNLNKCPMMRRMFRGASTPYLCWFDDDSYVTEAGALERQLRIARRSPVKTVMWGLQAGSDHSKFIDLADVRHFVRTAPWYRGLSPPDWRPGGKGEFNYEGRGRGNPWWQFITGGFWLIRTRAIRTLDWPDRRLVKLGDDVLLGEALRQQGWRFENTGASGIVVNEAPRRGEVGGLCSAFNRPSGIKVALPAGGLP